ncbi:MAG: glucose 1-dehydrogenase [Deltaproteobacteria bacterium]|nr:glucose 1-dehydrogenase [Deltaproteobacteria bacterium]
MTEAQISTPRIDLTGKVAIVTGASRGIGGSISQCFAKHGAKVVLAARKREALDEAVKTIESEGGDALAVTCHTGQEEQVINLVQTAISHYGKVDVLVNNAATNPYFGPLLDVESRAWDKTFDVNAKGYFMMTREVARHLIKRGAPGSIINIASIAGLHPAVAQGVYGMTKAAVISMTLTLAVELGGTGIRINSIAPGLVETKFSGALVSMKEVVNKIAARSPLRRIGQPDDVAGLALFLASDASNFITGQTIVVDGGQTIGV